MKTFPVTAILGPRQCGKITLARMLKADHYFDLENPRDAASLEQPQLALEDLRSITVIDETQRLPELFPLLRYLVDREKGQRFIILGSASRDLIRQSFESLAGRIGYHYLDGFHLYDVGANSAGRPAFGRHLGYLSGKESDNLTPNIRVLPLDKIAAIRDYGKSDDA